MTDSKSPEQGGQPRDRTVLVPNPGAASSRQAAPQAAVSSQYSSAALQEKIQIKRGLNPLVNSAATLLTVAIKLRTTMHHDDVPELHKRLIDEIKNFEVKARNSGANNQTLVASRYLLCSVIDEIVLNTPWGTSSGWSQHSLLSLFHQETFGGEKCFIILQRLLEAPGTHIDTLELFFLCLSLGFEGKYRLDNRGHEQLEAIRDNLFQTIDAQRGYSENDLSPHWEASVSTKKSMMNYIPMWVFVSVVFGALVLSYSGFRFWLYDSTLSTTSKIEAHLSSEHKPTNSTHE